MGREKKIEGKVTFAPFLCWGKTNVTLVGCPECSGYERWRDCYKPQVETRGSQTDRFYRKHGRDWKSRLSGRVER